MNVVDEALFQKAVTTLDMVKGDALSEHCVPMNLVALPILLPARIFLSSVRSACDKRSSMGIVSLTDSSLL